VCIGLRLDTRNRLASFFLDEEGTRYGWRKPVLGPAGPGSQYDVAFDAEGAPILTGEDGPRYVGRLPVDDPRVLEWTAEQRLAELAAEQEARARRDTEEDAIGAACRPLRVLYRQARLARQRTALLAVFIEEITR
jgi:hypothetical protein